MGSTIDPIRVTCTEQARQVILQSEPLLHFSLATIRTVQIGSSRRRNAEERLNQTERFYRIDQLLQERGTVPFADLQRALEVSRATLRRDLTYMKDRLHAPIVYDPDARGYRFVRPARGPKYQLPGLWFSPEEALALMTMYEMLKGLDGGGLLGPHVEPLMARLNAIVDQASLPVREMLRRIRIIGAQHRRPNLRWFETIGSALTGRRRLEIDYFSRHRKQRSTREISPLRLMHYRNNWYLDAWCHQSEDIRMFSLDAIQGARLLETRAKEVSLARVDEELGGGYGIYRRTGERWARLRFNAAAATWVRDEIWHDRQRIADEAGGAIVLEVPYSDTRELVMDILRHGENVEVLAPAELRRDVAGRIAAAARNYQESSGARA